MENGQPRKICLLFYLFKILNQLSVALKLLFNRKVLVEVGLQWVLSIFLFLVFKKVCHLKKVNLRFKFFSVLRWSPKSIYILKKAQLFFQLHKIIKLQSTWAKLIQLTLINMLTQSIQTSKTETSVFSIRLYFI